MITFERVMIALMLIAIVSGLIWTRWSIRTWREMVAQRVRADRMAADQRNEAMRQEAEAHGVGGTGEAAGVQVREVGRMPIKSGGSTRIGPAGHMAYVPLPTDRRS